MNTSAAALHAVPDGGKPKLDHKPGPVTAIFFVGLLAIGLLFTGWSLVSDVGEAGARTTTLVPHVLLGVALLIARGFELVNGFHDTANAVATVIYTHSMPPNFAVVWSGCFNFLGVLVTTHVLSSGGAGTTAVNHSGPQMSTIRNLAMAWELRLPAAIVISGLLYWLFVHLF